jgi:hypothetical protein
MQRRQQIEEVNRRISSDGKGLRRSFARGVRAASADAVTLKNHGKTAIIRPKQLNLLPALDATPVTSCSLARCLCAFQSIRSDSTNNPMLDGFGAIARAKCRDFPK